MTRIIPPGFVRLADREPTDSDREYWVAIPLRGDRWHLIGAHWDDEIKGFLDLGELPKDVDLDLIWTEQFLMTREGAEGLLGMVSDRAGSGKMGGMAHLVRGPAIVTGKSGGKVDPIKNVGNGSDREYWVQPGPISYSVGGGNGRGDAWLTQEDVSQRVVPAWLVGNGAGKVTCYNGTTSYTINLGNGCGGGTGTAKAPESNAWADHFYARNQGDGDDQTPQTQA